MITKFYKQEEPSENNLSVRSIPVQDTCLQPRISSQKFGGDSNVYKKFNP